MNFGLLVFAQDGFDMSLGVVLFGMLREALS